MKLYLLRHGEAEHRATSDASRQLTEKGRQQIMDVSHWLPDSLDIVLVSPLIRAQQSADIVEEYARVSRRATSESLKPDTPVADVMEWLHMIEVDTALIVGHNPLISALCNWLCDDGNLNFSTGNLACLEGDIPVPAAMTLKWLK